MTIKATPGPETFAAGEKHGRQLERDLILKMLRSDECKKKFFTHHGPMSWSAWGPTLANWIEEKLKEEK